MEGRTCKSGRLYPACGVIGRDEHTLPGKFFDGFQPHHLDQRMRLAGISGEVGLVDAPMVPMVALVPTVALVFGARGAGVQGGDGERVHGGEGGHAAVPGDVHVPVGAGALPLPPALGYTARDFRVQHRPRQHSLTVSRVTMSLELVTLDQWNAALAAGQEKWKTTGFLPDIFRAPWSPLDQYFGPFPVDSPPMAEEIEEAFPRMIQPTACSGRWSHR